MTTPRYPAAQLIEDVGGTAVVLANIDACGRVSSPRIAKSSGHDALDKAAMETVTAWVLNPAQRALATDGMLKLPVKFGGMQAPPKLKQVQWPKSHRRPYYLLDGSPIGFESIAEFRADGGVLADGEFKSPYGSVQSSDVGRTWTIFSPDVNEPGVFWLLYMVDEFVAAEPGQSPRRQNKTLALARYRLVLEDGKPVVRLGLLCEAEADACAQLQAFLLKGLPTAPPPRR